MQIIYVNIYTTTKDHKVFIFNRVPLEEKILFLEKNINNKKISSVKKEETN